MHWRNHFKLVRGDQVELGQWASIWHDHTIGGLTELLDAWYSTPRAVENTVWELCDHLLDTCDSAIVPVDGRAPPWNMPARFGEVVHLRQENGYLWAAVRYPDGMRPSPGWTHAAWYDEREERVQSWAQRQEFWLPPLQSEPLFNSRRVGRFVPVYRYPSVTLDTSPGTLVP